MRFTRLGLVGLVGTAMTAVVLAGCSNSDTREAAPAESLASDVASPSESASADESAIEESALEELTTEPIDNPEGQRVQGLYRSTQVCFTNRDEIGRWRNYVVWEKSDTKDDRRPAFGETVCAEGTFASGADVKGSIHLINEDKSSELVVKVSGTNYFDSEPEIELNGPGVSVSESFNENETHTYWTQSPGNPRRILEVKRLPDTKWIEFQITARSARTCKPGGECAVGDTGPGGGIVVYDAGSAQSWGRYLEIAPVGWSGSANDPTKIWCPMSSSKYGTNIGTARELGAGKANTAAIINACGNDTAAGMAAAYQGGGKSDWFLPSMNELYQVWQERNSNPVAMQDSVNYWTSSQAETDSTQTLKMAIELSNADWDTWDGPFFRAQVEKERHVRPMRAF